MEASAALSPGSTSSDDGGRGGGRNGSSSSGAISELNDMSDAQLQVQRDKLSNLELPAAVLGKVIQTVHEEQQRRKAAKAKADADYKALLAKNKK